MDRNTQHQLIENILQLEENNTTHMRDHSSSIATDKYTAPEQFNKEQSELFMSLPIIAGHISQVPEAGDYISRDICGVPVIIIRDQQLQLKAFINVCKHRGGRFIWEPQGSNLRVLVCQYHAWSYNTDGSLRGVPHKEGFRDMPEHCKNLSELPIDDRFGFLWIRLSPYADQENQDSFKQQLEDFIGVEVNADLSSYQLSSHHIFDPVEFHRPINWKLAIDTFLENYHVKKTHLDTIDCMFLDTVGYYQQFGFQQRNLYPKKSIVELRTQDRSEWNLRDHGNMLYTLFPNTLVLIEPDHINVSIVYPDGVDHCYLINFTLLPQQPDEKKAAYFRRNNKILYAALEEDFSMAGDVQKGLKSGANSTLLHGRFEQGLNYFHQSIDKLCD